jgi:hypothetical protein
LRTSIIIASLILCCSINSINAQWYSNNYGVENLNDLSDEQLMESFSKAKGNSVGGGMVTVTGLAVMFGGLVKSVNYTSQAFISALSFGGIDPPRGSAGGGLIITGAVLTIGGAVLWISGGSRKKQIRPIIKSRGLVSNISVYPGAGYELLTDTYYPAVTIRIGF